MAHCCFKQGCELEVQYVCLCFSSETFCCEFHLQAHLKLPNRIHVFDSIFIEPPEGTKDIILGFLAKEKCKKEKLKKIALASYNKSCQNSENSIEERLRKLNSDLEEISCLIEKISQISGTEEDAILNSLILENHRDIERTEAIAINCSESYSNTRPFYWLCKLRNKKREILNRVNIDREVERDFRRTCSLYKDNDPYSLFGHTYEEYVNAYQKMTSIYLAKSCDESVKLYIYDTESEKEEVKVLDTVKCWSDPIFIVPLPNGELFAISRDDYSSIAFIIDRNYQVRVLPKGAPEKCSTAIYANKSVYCFTGDEYNSSSSSYILNSFRKFDLNENRWSRLASNDGTDICYGSNSVLFHENILISVHECCNLLLYAIDIDSFSIIPYDFTVDRKILISTEDLVYVIECPGWIYENKVRNEYAWKRIARSKINSVYLEQVYFSYNKEGIYISIHGLVKNFREYYKFDLDRKALIDIAFYSKNLGLKRSGNYLEEIACYSQSFVLNPDHAAAYIDERYTLSQLGSSLDQIEECNKLIKNHPDWAGPWYVKGKALEHLGSYLEAIECYKEVLRLTPNNEETYYKIGEILMMFDRHLEAIEFYNKAINLNREFVHGYNLKAKALCYLERYLEAIECYDEILKRTSWNFYIFTLKGHALRNLDRNIEAIQCYNNSIKFYPYNSKVHYWNGYAYEKLNRKITAIKCYNKAIKFNPNYADAYKSKGNIYKDLNRNLKAIKCYNKAIKINPDDSEAYCLKGKTLYELNRYLEAIECFNEAIKLHPEFSYFYVCKAFALYGLGRFLEAVEFCNEASISEPKDADICFFKGLALIELGKYLEALESYDEAIRLEPDDADIYSYKGAVLHKLAKYPEEIQCYDELIRLKPDDAEAFNNKGVALRMLDKYDEAINCYNEAIRLEPGYVVAYSNKGLALHKLDNYIEEIECHNEAIRLKPDYAKAYFSKGVALGKLGKNIEAIEWFNEAIKFNPDNSCYFYHRAKILKSLGKQKEALQDFKKADDLKQKK